MENKQSAMRDELVVHVRAYYTSTKGTYCLPTAAEYVYKYNLSFWTFHSLLSRALERPGILPFVLDIDCHLDEYVGSKL